MRSGQQMIRMIMMKSKVAFVGLLVMGHGNLLPAQEFRITGIKLADGNRVVIDYSAQANGTYTLLQGNSVQNVRTPVATNSAATTGAARFSQPVTPANP